MEKTPQEIEVWYILPAVRRELALSMINDLNLSQKNAAQILGVTEPAISQYVKSKRAKEVKFDKELSRLVKESAKRIVENKDLMMEELQKLSEYIKKSRLLCAVHKTHSSIPEDCKICLGD